MTRIASVARNEVPAFARSRESTGKYMGQIEEKVYRTPSFEALRVQGDAR